MGKWNIARIKKTRVCYLISPSGPRRSVARRFVIHFAHQPHGVAPYGLWGYQTTQQHTTHTHTHTHTIEEGEEEEKKTNKLSFLPTVGLSFPTFFGFAFLLGATACLCNTCLIDR